MKALDFTTYQRDLSIITPSNLEALKAQGFQHAIVGMDSAPGSVAAVRSILDAGFSWDAYRYVYPNRSASADIDDVVAGILAVYGTQGNLKDLPGVVWLDIEGEPGNVPSQAQCIEAANRLASHEIGPDNIVQAGVYSGVWVWEQEGWGAWSQLAQMGLLLWANADQPLWGGWTDAQYAGYQTADNQPSPIGPIDISTMRDRTIALLKQPF